MFDTDINVWLQSMGSPAATALFTGVTLLGYLPFHALLIVSLTFGFRLRPGLVVLGAVLLTGIATEAAKEIVGFPRPDQVDDRLMRTYASGGGAIVPRGGASEFWALPADEVVERVREEIKAHDHGGYGFPSGHVSAATAFLAGAAWFVRARWLFVVSAAFVFLMALSRMYLGRHFLGDVLGGFAIALVASATWVRLFGEVDPVGGMWPRRSPLRGLWFLCALLFALVPWFSPISPRYAGALTGLALSYAVVFSNGAPPDGGAIRQRLMRILLALALFATTLGLGDEALTLAGLSGGRMAQWFLGAIVTASTFAGTIALGRRLRLFGSESARLS